MSSWWNDYDLKAHLVGKVIIAIYSDRENDSTAENLWFVCRDGTVIQAVTDGDCCSHTWFEAFIGLPDILFAPVTEVNNLDLPGVEQPEESWEFIQVYGLEIRTTNGVATIEYRNSSNGYYGGSCNASEVDPGSQDFSKLTQEA